MADYVNFAEGGPSQTGTAVLGSAGDQWNNLTPPVSNTGLIDSSGHSLNITPTILVDGFLDANGTAMDANTTPLMEQYAFNYTYNPISLRLSNLGAYAGDSFTLVLYSAGDVAGQGGEITVEGGASSYAWQVGTTNGATSGASRKISDGVGVAYNTLTGILNGSDLWMIISPLNAPNGSQYVALNGFN